MKKATHKKKLAILGVLGITLVSQALPATATATSGNMEKKLNQSNIFKDTDTIVELSSGVRVHGKVEIYNMSDLTKPILSLDTDKNAFAKKAGEVKNGAKLDVIQVPKPTIGGAIRS